MQDDIKIGLKVSSDGSTDAEIKKAEKLKRTLDLAAESSQRLGGTAGSRAAAARAARGAAGGAMSNEEFGNLRGTAGITGASARDFANQAQGLGGLVRVYATFAANLFAVSAAFNALREAAQTEQMVRGMEQLSATSGRSLGILSKELVRATGGAISLREAMTAVAQASSAGLANEQIKQLSIVANQASQALGLSMTDALNRLSRGISKIEPELLDELGIFVRVDTAVQNYALSLGRSASSLSEFERRQAFANAVLEEGNKKFGSIEAAPNPYDKLLASIKDLATAGLNLVNKVLTPIARILAESPSALTAVFAGIAGLLLKQAIPAIGQFRAGLRASAEDALSAADKFKKSFGDEFQSLIEKRFQLPQLEQGVKRAQKALADLPPPKSLNIDSVKALAAAEDVNKKAFDNANEALSRRNKIIETGKIGSKQASQEQIQQAMAEAKYIQKVIDLYNNRIQLQQAQNRLQDVADKPQGRFDPQTLQLMQYQKLKTSFDKAQAISTAAEAANVVGIRNSWALLNQEIADRGLKGFDKYSTQVRGGLAAIGTRITGIVGSLGIWGQALALLGAGYAAFDSFASEATKEQEKFNDAVAGSNEAIKTASDAFDLYTKKRKDGFGLQGVIAFNNALQGISVNIENQLNALEDFAEKAGPWDRLKERVLAVFGKSNLDTLRQGAKETVSAVLKTLEFSSNAGAAKSRIAEALRIPPEALDDVGKLNRAYGELNERDLRNLSEQIKLVAKEQQAAISSAQAFGDGLKDIGKAFDQIIQSTALNDPQAKLGEELISNAERLGNALEQDVLGALTAIAQAAKDPKFLTSIRLDPESIKSFYQAEVAVKKVNAAQEAVAKAQKEVNSAAKETATTFAYSTTEEMINAGAAQDAANERQKEAEKALEQAKENLQEVKKEAEGVALSQKKLLDAIIAEGLRKVALGLKNAQELAKISVEEAKLGPRAAAGLDISKREYDLTLQRLQVERAQIEEAFNTRQAYQENTNAIVELTASIDKMFALQRLEQPGLSAEDKRILQNVIDRSAKVMAASGAKAMLAQDPKSRAEAVSQFGQEAVDTAERESQARSKVASMQKEAALAKVNAETEKARIKFETDSNNYRLKLEKESLDLQVLKNSNAQQFVNIAQQIGDVQLDEVINAKARLDTQGANLALDKQLLDVRNQIAQLEKQSTRDKEEAELKKQVIERVKEVEKELEFGKALKTLEIELNRIRAIGATTQKNLARDQAAQQESLAQSTNLTRTILDARQREFDLLVQIGGFTNEFVVRAKTEVDLEQQRLKFLEDRTKLTGDLAQKEAALATARQILAAARETSISQPDNTAATQAVQTAEASLTLAQTQVTTAKNALSTADSVNAVIVASIDNIGKLNLKLAEQKTLFEQIKSTTESLGAVFGEFGTKLGGLLETITKVKLENAASAEATKKQLDDVGQRLQANAAAQEDATMIGDIEGSNRLLAEQKKLENDKAAIVKKSIATELQGNIQVINSTKKLFKEKTGAYRVLDAMEKAMHVQKMVMFAAEMGADLLKTGQAVINSITRVGASQTEAAANGVTAITEQGKGDPYTAFARMAAMAAFVAAILGKSVSKGSVPGGFTAKEQQEVQGTGQQYVNGQLVSRMGGVLGDDKARADSIVSSIDKLSEEFFGSLGSGSSKIVQALEGIKKNTAETVKALLGSVSGFGMPGSAFGTVESSSKKLGGLWGSSSTSIADAGVRISGTLDNLGKSIGEFQQYENVVKTSRSWFGLVKNVSTATNIKAFEESTTKLFANIFKSVQTVLLESAIALEGPTSAASEAIKNIPVQLNVSLKGLTGEQAVEAVLAELSVQLNQGAQRIFPYIADYQQIGEELYETVARIVKDSETLTQGLAMVGVAIQGLGTEARIALEQKLLDLLGGTDKAVASINFYYENFLSNEERFRIQFNKLTKTFTDAGKTLPQTKQQFTNLLNSLDIVNNIEDQKTFALLINNAEKYNDLLELQSEIIGDSKEKFESFAKSLLSFKDSLLLGSATILTPIERYAKAKTEFETIRAKALAGDEEGLSKLQDASQTFLNVSRELYASGQQYTTDFNSVLVALEASASEAQKQADMGQMQLDALNTQIGVLQNIERILTLQQDTRSTTPTTPSRAEALAAEADEFAAVLFDKFGTYIDTYLDRTLTGERANGGYASGVTLVGERGPELVDFNRPGMVYTAEQTRGMFAPRSASGQAFNAMVSELQDLREEVVQLRKEQQKQTGDMIITNYDAQQKVANEIVDAVMKSVQEKSWQDKNKPTIS